MNAPFVAGLLLGSATGRLAESYLYQVKPLDIWTYIAVVPALLIIGSIAAFLPARKAASIEPLEALRDE